MSKIKSYTESHKNKGMGENYDKRMYSEDTWSNRVWQIEKYLLSKILSGKKNCKVLDFATGTGRIPEFLEKIGFQNITGIDASKAMLKPAKKKLRKTNLLCLNITKNKDFSEVKREKFGVILSFRFFLNIERELGDNIMKKLSKIIKDDGIFIFNMHANKYSLIGAKELIRSFNKKKGNLLSVKEIKSLVNKNGFSVKEIYSYGFIPHKKRFSFLNYKVWYFLEKLFISKRNLTGGNLIVICKKKK